MAEWLRELAIYYAQCVEVLCRLARTLIGRPHRVRQAGPVPQGWPYATAGLLPGISEVAAIARPPAPAPEAWVTHPLDLDIGEVADGYHLIARSIALSAEHLLLEFAFAPGPTGETEAWLNMSYRISSAVLVQANGFGSLPRRDTELIISGRPDGRAGQPRVPGRWVALRGVCVDRRRHSRPVSHAA